MNKPIQTDLDRAYDAGFRYGRLHEGMFWMKRWRRLKELGFIRRNCKEAKTLVIELDQAAEELDQAAGEVE